MAFRGNPLLIRDWLSVRRGWWRHGWLLALALFALYATAAAVTVRDGGGIASGWHQFLIAMAGLLAPAWLVALLAVSVLAALYARNERALGSWELLRLTPLSAVQIADGYIGRALLRRWYWWPIAAALPLQALTFVDSGAFPGPLHGVLLLAWCLFAGTLYLAQAVLQALVSAAIGVLAGLRTGSSVTAALLSAGLLLGSFLLQGCAYTLVVAGTVQLGVASERGELFTPGVLFGLLGLGFQWAIWMVARDLAAAQVEPMEPDTAPWTEERLLAR